MPMTVYLSLRKTKTLKRFFCVLGLIAMLLYQPIADLEPTIYYSLS